MKSFELRLFRELPIVIEMGLNASYEFWDCPGVSAACSDVSEDILPLVRCQGCIECFE